MSWLTEQDDNRDTLKELEDLYAMRDVSRLQNIQEIAERLGIASLHKLQPKKSLLDRILRKLK